MIFLLILLVIAIAGDVTVHQKYLKEKRSNERLMKAAEKMVLKESEDVISYLEASSEVHAGAAKLLKQLKSLPPAGQSTVAISGPPNPAPEPVKAVPLPPAWLHDNGVRMPPQEQWELFLKDLGREKWEDDKIGVLEHWTVNMDYSFTLTEQSIVLDLFENTFLRNRAREIMAKKDEEETEATA